MKKNFLLLKTSGLLIISSTLLLGISNESVKAEDDNWTLVWQDEFNGDSLDLSKWCYQEGTGTDVGLTDWGNNELEYYSKDNVYLEDGQLVIEARKENMGNKNYTSGRINTKGKFGTTYGKIEAAITMPEGQGLWPAFWMLPTEDRYGSWASSGELDIMEARGRILNQVGGTIHYGNTWPYNEYTTESYTFPNGTDITTQHIYSVEWEEGKISWYVDGDLYYSTNNWYSAGGDFPAPFDQDFYILLNLAIGGNYDNYLEPDSTVTFPAKMKVDYVRVYEKANSTTGDNLIKNGDFSNGLENWGTWSLYDTDKTVVPERGSLTYHIINKREATWSSQLYQELNIEGGKTYKLSFDAYGTAARPIIVEFAGSNLSQTLAPFNITTNNTTYETEIYVPNDTSLKLNFLLGNIGNTPSYQHALVFDNISLVAIS